jgi:hypothetical protein
MGESMLAFAGQPRKGALMKMFLATAAAVLGAASVVPASNAASGRCYSKSETVKGKSVIVSCGTATATITYKGKTYKFSQGQCVSEGKSITLDLGTQLVVPAADNDGFTYFSMTTLSSTLPAQIEANQGPLSINGSAKFTGTKQGTFSGINASFGGVNTSKKPVPFTGTYNCAGAIYPF